MDKSKKIAEIPENDLKNFISEKIRVMFLDLDQTTNGQQYKHVCSRTLELLKKSYNFMNINEIDSCFDNGMASGFGSFRKLTYQVVSEWFEKRKREFYQKNTALEQNEKNEIKKGWVSISKSNEYKIISLKRQMYDNGEISAKTRFEYSFLRCYAFLKSGKSIEELRKDLILCDKTENVTTSPEIEQIYQKELNEYERYIKKAK